MDQIRTIIEPIRKKWVYHFIISSKTNNIEKPEWYLNQTLKWIYEKIDTIESKVRLEANRDASGCRSVKHMFIVCMLELPMMRLTKDIKKISNNSEDQSLNEVLLVHTYNEVMQFCKVIRQLLGDCYNDLDEKTDLLSVFSDRRLFEKIIDIEWEYASKNLAEITDSPIRWDPVIEGEFVDNYKIPRCVDRLLMLVRSITERVECFLQIDCQFQLIELQCYLLNKFLKFLRESTGNSSKSMDLISDLLLLKDESTIDLTRVLKILNGVNFLRLALKVKFFIPKNVIPNLDVTLEEKSKKLTMDYKLFYENLVKGVAKIYRYAECNPSDFLNFVEPKLSPHIFEYIKDEISELHQKIQTQNLLEGMFVGEK